MSSFEERCGQESTSTTESSHLIHYIYEYVFWYFKCVLETYVHLMYHFKMLFTLNCVLTTTPSELSTLLLGAELLEQEAQSHKKILFRKFVIFSKKVTFSKISAGNRAPPKQSLLTSLTASMCITFYTLIAFPNHTPT